VQSSVVRNRPAHLVFIVTADFMLSLVDPETSSLGLRTNIENLLNLLHRAWEEGFRIDILPHTLTEISQRWDTEISTILKESISFATLPLYRYTSESLENTPIRRLDIITAIELTRRENCLYIIVSPVKKFYQSLVDEYRANTGIEIEIWNRADLNNFLDNRDEGGEGGDGGNGGSRVRTRPPSSPNGGNSPGGEERNVAASFAQTSSPQPTSAYSSEIHTSNRLARLLTYLGILLAPFLFKGLKDQALGSASTKPEIRNTKQQIAPITLVGRSQNALSSQRNLSQSTSQTASSSTQQSVATTEDASALVIAVNPRAAHLQPTPTTDSAPSAINQVLESNLSSRIIRDLITGDQSLMGRETRLGENSIDPRIPEDRLGPLNPFSIEQPTKILGGNIPQLQISVDIPSGIGINVLSDHRNRPTSADLTSFEFSFQPPTKIAFDGQAQTTVGNLPPTVPPSSNITPPLSTDGSIAIVNPTLTNPIVSKFSSGVFTVGTTGIINVDFLFDGGANAGELGIFSLSGLEQYDLESEAFIQEVIRRVTSDSVLGGVALSDAKEGARFSDPLNWSNSNSGPYEGPKTLQMRPGDQFGFVLISNGTFQEILNNPSALGNQSLLFSLTTTQPSLRYPIGQIANATGTGNIFAMEDIPVTQSDRDYNDIIFRLSGATGSTEALDSVIDRPNDWRLSSVGQEVLQSTQLVGNSGAPGNINNSFSSTNGLFVAYTQLNQQPPSTGSTVNSAPRDYSNSWVNDRLIFPTQTISTPDLGDSNSNSSVPYSSPLNNNGSTFEVDVISNDTRLEQDSNAGSSRISTELGNPFADRSPNRELPISTANSFGRKT
jgi:Domain of unknown function (DUF4114)